MFITESELRALWRDGRNPLPAFPRGTRFSPAAQDFIKDHRLEIQFAPPPAILVPQLPLVDNPLPYSLDALHALVMLAAAEARRYQLPSLAGRLDALAADCQALLAAARQGRDPTPLPPASASATTFAPGPTDHAILHWLNLLRANAAQAAAQAAANGQPAWAAALGRVSDAASDLGRRVQSGELGWRPVDG